MKRVLAGILMLIMLICSAPLTLAESGSSSMPETGEYVANEVIITQKTDAKPASPLPLESAEVIDTSAVEEDDALRVIKGTVTYGTDIEGLCENLEHRADVVRAEPNYIQHLDTVAIPAEAAKTSSDYNGFNWYRDALDLTQAWQSADTLGSADITVAVIDTGINAAHKEFEGALWDDGNGNCGYNAVKDNYDVSDTNGHGTNVAGIIAMRANGFGYVGIAPQVKIMPLKAASSSEVSDACILACLNYALEHDADIINMSFSGGQLSTTMARAYQHAARQTVLIAAAGNEGADAAVSPEYPAACNGVIGVMSYGSFKNADLTDYTIDNGALTSFSNYDTTGEYYQIAAPGVQIYGPSHKNNTGFAFLSGTSQATPIVSGAAALYLSTHPGATPYQVRTAVTENSDKTLKGYYTNDSFRRIDLSAVLAAPSREDETVALSAPALAILSECLDTPLSEAHRSDTDALTLVDAEVLETHREDLPALAELTGLQALEMNGLGLTNNDVAWLSSAAFSHLSRLDVSDNPALTTLPLTASTAPILRELSLDNCSFENLEGTVIPDSLYTLCAACNRFRSSYGLRGANKVYEIDASGCALQDVRAFADFKNLIYLDVSNNCICDIAPLACFRGCYLNVSDNPLHLGVKENCQIRSIETFMKDNPYRYSEIKFLHANPNGNAEKTYTAANSLCAPRLRVARTAAASRVALTVAPADANVNSYCLFESDDSVVKVNTFTGALSWTPADITADHTVPMTVCPVSGFAAFTTQVDILAPKLTAFTYQNGTYTLTANTATDTVTIGDITLNDYSETGDERHFTVPNDLPYSSALSAVPADCIGKGAPCPIGTTQPATDGKAALYSFTADKEVYDVGNTAVLTVTANTATQCVKLKDCVQNSEIISTVYTESGEKRIFTFTLPVTAQRDYKFKAYASADGTFGIGAKVLRFTSEPVATALTLTSDNGNSLYFHDNANALTLTAHIYPESAAARTAVHFESADTAVATVTQSGKVSAAGYGSTVITATTDNGLRTAFPLFVRAPKLSTIEMETDSTGATLTCYTTGAATVLLKNADGSDSSLDYEALSFASAIDGYDTRWQVRVPLTGESAQPLRVYALDENGITAHSLFRSVTLTPDIALQSFSFEQSEYTFDRNGGAVKIALQTVPEKATAAFSWNLSNNTVASVKSYGDYAVITPKKTGSVVLSAACKIGGETCTQSTTLTFTEGIIYSAVPEKTTLHCYEEVNVLVITDQSVRYLNLTDTDNNLSEEYASYVFYRDENGKRIWNVPFFFKRESTALQVSGGDSAGNLSAPVNMSVNVTMPEDNFAANPPVVKGKAGGSVNFNLISLPSRANLSYSAYTVTVENEAIASFRLGTLHLLSEGETTLHCVYGDKQTDVRVIVENPAKSLSFEESTLTLSENETYTLHPTAAPASAEHFRFTSSDAGVVSVNENGVITAGHEGTATVTATAASGVSASITVKVKSAEVITTLSFDADNYTLSLGDTLAYHLQSNAASLCNKVTFSSSNTNILSVGEDGVFTALKEGTVRIEAVADSGITAAAMVTVTADRILTLSRETVTATVKDLVFIMPLLSPDGADVDGVWYSDNEAVASINQSGYLSAKSPGSCNIFFVSDRGEIATCTVQVYFTYASKLTLNTDDITLNLNEHFVIDYSAVPSYTSETPDFSSADEAIAAVDQNGIIYAVGIGSTIVTATLQNGNTYPIAVTVTGAEITLSGTSNTAATMHMETLQGTETEAAVENAFALEKLTAGTYRLTLSAPHHTTLTIEDAALFADTNLGTLHLCNGDANGDGVVDIADITALLNTAHFGTAASAQTPSLDINDDGMLDILDVTEILLAENYGGSDTTVYY